MPTPDVLSPLDPWPPFGASGASPTGGAGTTMDVLSVLDPWPPFVASAAATEATAPDLLAAAVARLRSHNGGAFALALGETPAAPKIEADRTLLSPANPWARVHLGDESHAAEAGAGDGLAHYTGRGQLVVTVFAATKLGARRVRAAALAALNDAPLEFADGALLGLWPEAPGEPVAAGVGVDAAGEFAAAAVFTYFVDRTY